MVSLLKYPLFNKKEPSSAAKTVKFHLRNVQNIRISFKPIFKQKNNICKKVVKINKLKPSKIIPDDSFKFLRKKDFFSQVGLKQPTAYTT